MTDRRLPSVALIGCGYWGRNLARNLVQIGVLHSVCDEDAAAAKSIADSAGVRAGSLDQILSDETIAAVVIATPPSTHSELAIRALESGKDVFVEKPLALRVSEAEAVVETARRTGRLLMVGHLLRYHPVFRMLEGMVRAGDLGPLRYVYSHRLNLGKIRKVENILWSFSPHDLSMILSLVGDEPDVVDAVGAAYLQEGINDVTTTHLSFPGGEAAHVFVSWLHPFKEQKLVVIGERAMAVFDDTQPWDSKLTLYEHEVAWNGDVPEAFKAEPKRIPVIEEEPLLNECAHFLDCVSERSQPLTDGPEAIRVLKVLERAEGSMRQRLGRS